MYENVNLTEWDIKKNNLLKNEGKTKLIYGTKGQESALISIMIPTYRRANLLREALDSALRQTYTGPYQIVVVDNEHLVDFETDRLMKEYCSNNTNICYYRNTENLGMYGNWNKCIELCNTEWYCMLHDDDKLKPEYLEKITEYIKDKTDASVISVYRENLDLRENKNSNKQFGKLGKNPITSVIIQHLISTRKVQQLTPWFNDLIADNRLRQSAHDIGPVAGCEADAAVLGIFNTLRQSPLPPSFTKRQGILKMLSDYTDGMVLRVALSNLDSRNLLLNNVVRNNRFRHATIDDLAEQCHCSRSSFKELFHKHYDTSPYHYFLEQRLEKAQSLLTGSSYSISEISEICEFNSPSHFARIFRSYFACSPSEYRRQQQLKKWL